MSIDPDGDVPVYQQLAAILRDRIVSGEIPPRRALPSIRMLCQEFGVAKGSAERALNVLRREGLVHTVFGRGVYVTPPGERGG